jgi:hypothetical protein
MAVNKITNMRVDDILDRVATAKTRKEKIEVLQRYNNRGLRDVLKGAFDDNVQFNLPEGAPPYNPGSETGYGSTLLKQSKRFRYFVKTPNNEKSNVKIERMYIQMLEALHPNEAQIVVWMKDKDLNGKYKGLTKKLVSDAFPGLISSE